MQYFFNTNSPVGQATIVPPSWRHIKDGLTRNYSTVMNYYNNRVMAVRSNHLLIRLLTGLGVSYSHHIERYHQIVEAKSLSYSMGFKLTSSLYRGALFKNVFYGENVTEVLMATDEVFNPYEAYDNWKTLKPVKCVYHNRSDLDLLLPNGKTSGTEEGLAVISINIPMLAIQFRAFLEETYKYFLEDNALLSPASHFIHMYVLPGMLESQLDIALFNRAYNISIGRPMTQATKQHPFYITDYSVEVDKHYTKIVDYLKTNDKDFKSVFETLQAFSGNFNEILRLPEIASTRQVAWTEVISRLNCIDFLTSVTQDKGWRRNAASMNMFKRTFTMFASDATIKHALPNEYKYEIDRTVSSIFNIDYSS